MKPGRAGKILFLLLLLFIPTDVLLAQCVPTSTAAGSLDNCFGNGGMVVTDITPDRDFARAMAIQSDGKIVVAGVAGYNASSNISDFLVVRYNVDGSLDPTFDGDGIVVTDFGFGAVDDDYCRGVAIQPDGKIILAGRSQVSAETYALAVVRYNPNGSLDSTFDGDGKAQFELGAIVEMYGFACNPTERCSLPVARSRSRPTLTQVSSRDSTRTVPSIRRSGQTARPPRQSPVYFLWQFKQTGRFWPEARKETIRHSRSFGCTLTGVPISRLAAVAC